MELTLYQRDTCHLCDLALEILADARVPDFESVFIDGDDALEARYGLPREALEDVGEMKLIRGCYRLIRQGIKDGLHPIICIVIRMCGENG